MSHTLVCLKLFRLLCLKYLNCTVYTDVNIILWFHLIKTSTNFWTSHFKVEHISYQAVENRSHTRAQGTRETCRLQVWKWNVCGSETHCLFKDFHPHSFYYASTDSYESWKVIFCSCLLVGQAPQHVGS